jgi:hypothetical protein
LSLDMWIILLWIVVAEDDAGQNSIRFQENTA